mmetsp:Transcript_27157/g.67229  ORF Transcript_27157/g.67229 Transcript_27157/m.67229 type:complete len:877 (-) Transcript_27157:365-2995(-)
MLHAALVAHLAVATSLDLSLIVPLSRGPDDLGVDFKRIACGARLAASHIGSHDESVVDGLASLVDGVQINITVFDSRMSQPTSIRAYRQHREAGAHAIVGAALSSVSTVLATLSSIDRVPMCSYWSSSPSLTNKQTYPLFARSYPSDAATTQALPVVLKQFGWSTVGVLHANDAYANAYAEGLRQSTNTTVAVAASFEVGQPETFASALDTIKVARVNIIVAIVFDGDAVEMLQQAEALGIYGADFAWITTDATTSTGAIAAAPGGDTATARRLLDGLLNFYVSPQGSSGYDRFSSAWRSAEPSDCANDVFAASSVDGLFSSPFPVAAYAYDCVVALAAAAARAPGGPSNSSALYEELLGVAFEGASGEVHFDGAGDRAQASVNYVLTNWHVAQSDSTTLNHSLVATLNGGLFRRTQTAIQWPGGGPQPRDRFEDDVATFLPQGLTWPAVAITAACVVMGVGFAVWTVYHRHSRVVKSAQPGFLCAIVLGSLLSLSSVFPAAIDHRGTASAQDEGARFVALDLGCNLQAGLYAVGFMITFSSLLTKLWRITRIVNNLTVAGKKLVSGRVLATFSVALVVSQAIVVLLMWSTAPLYFRVTVERVHGFAVNSYGTCDIAEGEPTAVYLLLTLGAQMLLLIYANVLCYQARRIPSEYAETKYVAFACANHLQTKAFAILAAAFTYNEPQVTFTVKWLALTVSDFGTLCLIFLPKIWMLHHDGSAMMTHAKDKLREAAAAALSAKEEKSEKATRWWVRERRNTHTSDSCTCATAGISSMATISKDPSDRNSDDSPRRYPFDSRPAMAAAASMPNESPRDRGGEAPSAGVHVANTDLETASESSDESEGSDSVAINVGEEPCQEAGVPTAPTTVPAPPATE